MAAQDRLDVVLALLAAQLGTAGPHVAGVLLTQAGGAQRPHARCAFLPLLQMLCHVAAVHTTGDTCMHACMLASS